MPLEYQITRYTRKKAARIGVRVRLATNPQKKLDVFRHGKKLASVGAREMNDYPTYWRRRGKAYATQRRRLYKQRHESDRHRRWSRGWLADQLLW